MIAGPSSVERPYANPGMAMTPMAESHRNRVLRARIPLPAITSAGDTVQASSSLLAAVAAGEVTPDEAGRVMALLTAHKSLVETGDLEARILALEAQKK